ncbi:hypothetical protein D3C75_1035560 [compost metagenome]
MGVGIGFVLDHPGFAPVPPVKGSAALFILNVVVMRLGPALIDKVIRQLEVVVIVSHLVQAHQRQLDFRMPRIAV